MINNDLIMRQACDHVYTTLQAYLNEPNDSTRETFFRVVRHYLNQGYRFQLGRGAVTCTRQQAQLAQLRTITPTGDDNEKANYPSAGSSQQN